MLFKVWRSVLSAWIQERKWSHILETVAKKTLVLVKIKLVTLNLYELIRDKMKEEFVNMTETEKQLDKVYVPTELT